MPCAVWQHKACTRAFCLLSSANHGRCIYVMSIDSALSTRHVPSCTLPRFTRFRLRESSLSHAHALSLISLLFCLPLLDVLSLLPGFPNTSSCGNNNPAHTAGSKSVSKLEPYSYCRYSTLQYTSNEPGGNTASMTPSLIQSRTDLRYRGAGAFGAQLAALVNCRELVHCWVSCYPVVIAACLTNPNAPDQGQIPMPTCLRKSSSTGIYPAHETRVDQQP
jgi:hypothetical protein